jgi:hypothetical protein
MGVQSGVWSLRGGIGDGSTYERADASAGPVLSVNVIYDYNRRR